MKEFEFWLRNGKSEIHWNHIIQGEMREPRTQG